MSDQIFLYSLVIKPQHIDSFGHVNNAAYLTLFEEARWDLMINNGYDLKFIQQTGLGPAILEVHMKFLKELRLDDHVEIQSQLISYEGKIGRIIQKMRRNDQECCVLELVFGLFNLKDRKLVLPTPEWLAAIGHRA